VEGKPKTAVEISGRDGGPIETRMESEQINARINELLSSCGLKVVPADQ
jgi:hypothetical protein